MANLLHDLAGAALLLTLALSAPITGIVVLAMEKWNG